mmetsp:Transcript_1189/g.3210  ORF Transcript_1189/g.3210 Transcript_1189/m.3210 type:complete len:233 (-) Transcript_1189:43-741(-)
MARSSLPWSSPPPPRRSVRSNRGARSNRGRPSPAAPGCARAARLPPSRETRRSSSMRQLALALPTRSTQRSSSTRQRTPAGTRRLPAIRDTRSPSTQRLTLAGTQRLPAWPRMPVPIGSAAGLSSSARRCGAGCTRQWRSRSAHTSCGPAAGARCPPPSGASFWCRTPLGQSWRAVPSCRRASEPSSSCATSSGGSRSLPFSSTPPRASWARRPAALACRKTPGSTWAGSWR